MRLMKTARLKEMVPHRDILLENQYNTGIPETSTNTLLQDDKHANVKIKCVCVSPHSSASSATPSLRAGRMSVQRSV